MSAAPSHDTSNVCQANIGKAGRRRRQQIGVGAAGVSVALLAVLIGVHAPWFARLSLFAPVMGSAVSLLQASRRT